MREPWAPLEVTSLEAVVNDYISRGLVQDPILLPLGNAVPQLEIGVLSSLRTLMHVRLVQERFGIVVDDAGKSGGRE